MTNKNFIISFLSFSFLCLILAPIALAQIDVPFFNLFQQNEKSSPLPKVSSSDFILTWSADTYTPANYPGKSLPAYNSLVEVLLLPATKNAPDLSSLNFNWYIDDVRQEYKSGKNLPKFLFKTSVLGGQRHYISLKITNDNNQEALSLSTTINVVSPEIIIYPAEKQTSDFIADGTGQTNASPGQEKSFISLPYFFSVSQPNNLNFQWTFDGQTINKTDEKNKFSIKISDGELTDSFQKELSVLAINLANEIQRASGAIAITIGK